MPKSAAVLAGELLRGEAGGLEELLVHEFFDEDGDCDEEAAHDDELVDKLYEKFSRQFDKTVTALSKTYGQPARTGEEDDDVIPLCGVFRFAVWTVADKQLFVAAAHEDRELPILLLLGTVDGKGK